MRGQNGITIVALIITVIIMLILTGVVINGITKENGLIKGTNEAVILSSLKEVDEALNEYSTKQAGKKIRQGDYSGEMNMQELVDLGILKKIEVGDTLRTIGIIQDLKKIGIKGKLGKGAKKIEQDNINTLSEISDVYAIDFEDNMLYYIKGDVWSITGTKTIREINQVALEKKKFITTWEVGEGESIVLPIPQNYSSSYECEVEIIHEDENKNQTLEQTINIKNNSSVATEEFNKSRTIVPKSKGKYIIKIGGVCKDFNFNDSTSKEMIIGIAQFGEVDIKILDLSQCVNLVNIAEPTDKSFREVTKISFYKTSINEIPINFLSNAPNLEEVDFSYTKIEEIPNNLFDNNIKIKSFLKVFQNTNIKLIPEGLFDNNIEATNFRETFSECKQLLEIPEGLFKNNPKVKDFSGTFRNTQIQQIPTDLFRYNTEVLYFSNGNMGWGGCFNGCKNIKEIPSDIFKYNTKVISFSGIFLGTGITKIPEGLFKNNIEVIDFSCAFQSTSIQEIPEDLFKYNEKVTNFYRTFHASTLQSIPINLFVNNKNVEKFSETFNACNKLSGSVPELWNGTDATKENYFPNVTSYNNCFSNTPSAIRAQVPTAWGGTNTDIVIE